MNITDNRTEIILDALLAGRFGHFESADEYGEPGYTNPDKCIILGNWNEVPRWIQDYLEEAGFELEWSDEWYIHYESSPSKAWRTSPDCYSWQCQVRFCDGFVLTPDDDVSDWLEELSSTSPSQDHKAVPDWITEDTLAEHGFRKFNGDFESGWHPGQTDDPNKIAKEVFSTVEDVESVVFRIAETSQFYVVFECYFRVADWEEQANAA